MARLGRPPRYETVGPVDFHLGLRFDRLRAAQLTALVALENEKVKRAGKKPRLTRSSLVSAWIRERLDTEIRRHGLVTKMARAAEHSLKADARNSPKKRAKNLWDAQLAEMRARGK